MERSSQVERLWDVMRDERPHSTYEIVSRVYDIVDKPTIARLSARIFDMKKRFSCSVRSWPDQEDPKMWWYQAKVLRFEEALV
jgi:hypothetical protein